MLQFGETVHLRGETGSPSASRAQHDCSGKRITSCCVPGEHAKFTAINRTGTISFGLLFMLGAFPLYLTFERELRNPKSQIPNPKSDIAVRTWELELDVGFGIY